MAADASKGTDKETMGHLTTLNLASKAASEEHVDALPSPATRRGILHQIMAAMAANITAIGLGTTLGYSAVALPQLQKSDSLIPISEDQASWIASLSAASISLGCLFSGWLMERFGRRTTLQFLCVPCVLGWTLIATARNVAMLYAGRFLVGLGGGMVDSSCQVYVGEISQPHIRGMLAASPSLCFSLGVLLVYTLGSVMPWHLVAGLCTAFPVLAYIFLSLVPESPYWFIGKLRLKEAEKSLQWLRGDKATGKDELEMLLASGDVQSNLSTKELFHVLLSRSTLRPFFIMLVFFFFQQFCGMNAVVFYTVTMFQEAGSQLDEYLSTVVIGLTRAAMTAITCVLLSRCGRRPLSLVSGLGMTVAMVSLGTYLYISGVGNVTPSVEPEGSLIPLLCLTLYICMNTVGFFAVPWVMMSEVFPARCRGLISGITTSIVYVFVFIVVKSYPMLLHSLGQHAIFWLYGGVSFAGFCYVLFVLPETKGKSLEEIEAHFSRKKGHKHACMGPIALWKSQKNGDLESEKLPAMV